MLVILVRKRGKANEGCTEKVKFQRNPVGVDCKAEIMLYLQLNRLCNFYTSFRQEVKS